MTHLVIDYRLEGKRPGYGWVGSTEGFDEQVLNKVWRGALPRGKGWGEARLVGARSTKGFRVDPRIMALSDAVVTDREDEGGRRGIRKAAIELVPQWRYTEHLQGRLAELPAAAAERKLTLTRWLRVIERLLPKLNRKRSQVVLSHPYESPEQWRTVEALVYTLASSGMVKTVWGGLVSFTTLALTNQAETRIVAVPHAFRSQVRGVPVIDLG